MKNMEVFLLLQITSLNIIGTEKDQPDVFCIWEKPYGVDTDTGSDSDREYYDIYPIHPGWLPDMTNFVYPLWVKKECLKIFLVSYKGGKNIGEFFHHHHDECTTTSDIDVRRC